MFAADGNPFQEQEQLEEALVQKALTRFGVKEKESTKEYDFVFDDQIDFIRDALIEGENVDEDERVTERLNRNVEIKSEEEMMQEARRSLPIYPYREDLLKAIEDHQVSFGKESA